MESAAQKDSDGEGGKGQQRPKSASNGNSGIEMASAEGCSSTKVHQQLSDQGSEPCRTPVTANNFDHIYSHVAVDHEHRRSKDSDHYNPLLDSQIELPDLNDLIDSPLVPPVPREYTLTRSLSGVAFGGDGNTVQIEEDSIQSFDTESDSRSLLANDTLTEISDIYASATTCQSSDIDIYATPDDDSIEPVYEEIPFALSRGVLPAARGSGISSDETICSEENVVGCHLAAKSCDPENSLYACPKLESPRVPASDVTSQKTTSSSSSSSSSSVESKPRDDTMAFFKRSFAKVRLDLLFRKKKSTKFVECVEKVIEARRSGCIDEDGNIVKTLDEQLKKHEQEKALVKNQIGDALPHQPSGPIAEAEKPQALATGVPSPDHQESYPLPEEDDGSEGYASASEIETVESSGTASGLERSPRLSGILSNRSSQHGSESGGDVDGDGNPIVRRASSRRVRFSDEVEEFEHIHTQLTGKQTQDSSDEDETGSGEKILISSHVDHEDAHDDDACVLSLTRKISLFESMSKMQMDANRLHPKLTRTSGHRHSDPGPTRKSMMPENSELGNSGDETSVTGQTVRSITKARVQVFEELSLIKPGDRRIPKPKPRASLLEIRMNQTRQKIMFFEQLKHGKSFPSGEED